MHCAVQSSFTSRLPYSPHPAQVPIAADSDRGRAKVTQLVRDLGFTPVDLGPLRQSRYIEAVPMEFFNSWRGAFVVVSVMFLVGYVLNFIK